MNANTFQSGLFRWLRQMSLGMTGGSAVARQKIESMLPGRVMLICQPGVIQVCQGAVWLTGTPAKADVILRAGENFELKDNCPYVVEALTEAKIVIKGDLNL